MAMKAIPDGRIRAELESGPFPIESTPLRHVVAMMARDGEAQCCHHRRQDHSAKAYLNSLQSLAILLLSDAEDEAEELAALAIAHLANNKARAQR